MGKRTTVADFVNPTDLAAKFLEAASLAPHADMTARSLLPILSSETRRHVGPSREAAFVAIEPHDGCLRGRNRYSCRTVRDRNFLSARNFEPTHWPSGSPNTKDCTRGSRYGEIDSSPTKTLVMENRDDPAVDRLEGLALETPSGHECDERREVSGQR